MVYFSALRLFGTNKLLLDGRNIHDFPLCTTICTTYMPCRFNSKAVGLGIPQLKKQSAQ